MSGIREINEQSMINAHKAGRAFYKRNKPNARRSDLESVARSCGWHDEDCTAWLAGFYGEQTREAREVLRVQGVRLPE